MRSGREIHRPSGLLCGAVLGTFLLSVTGAAQADGQVEPSGKITYVDPLHPPAPPPPPASERPWFWWVVGGGCAAAVAVGLGLGLGLGLPKPVTVPDGYPQQPVAIGFSLRVPMGAP